MGSTALAMVFSALTLAAPEPAHAFAYLAIGDQVPELTLPGLTGGTVDLVTATACSVFVFFRPGQENSERVLTQVSELAKRHADKSIHWIGIVSSTYPAADVQALAQAVGLTIPIGVDKGDALYGKLGVILHPSVGVVDRAHRLVAYQPFRKVGFADMLEAQVRRVLGEISEGELAQVLNPAKAVDNDTLAKAQTHLRMAEMLFKMKSYEGAAASARKSIENDPTLAAARGLLAAALANAGNCAGAQAEIAAALALDPREPRAIEAKRLCPAK